MLVSPTYHGICGDIKGIAEIVHRYDIPLLIDEAHGAHFAFHPDLPSSALSAGADLVIQSTHHFTLPLLAFTFYFLIIRFLFRLHL